MNFLLVFSRVMARARQSLRDEGLVTTVPLETPPGFFAGESAALPAEIPLESIENMDDAAIPLLDTADRLAARIGAAASILQTTFSAFALRLNWERGKSDI